MMPFAAAVPAVTFPVTITCAVLDTCTPDPTVPPVTFPVILISPEEEKLPTLFVADELPVTFPVMKIVPDPVWYTVIVPDPLVGPIMFPVIYRSPAPELLIV